MCFYGYLDGFYDSGFMNNMLSLTVTMAVYATFKDVLLPARSK